MHTPSGAVTIWLLVSVPLVAWDAGYVLLRPHSMPGHKLHSPLWTPYALYGTIDYIYGWPAYNARNGFTAAQTMLNVFESIAYVYYLWVVYRHGAPASSGRGRKVQKNFKWMLTGDKVVPGRVGATALLVVYSASLMTLGKTILYCKSHRVTVVYATFSILFANCGFQGSMSSSLGLTTSVITMRQPCCSTGSFQSKSLCCCD